MPGPLPPQHLDHLLLNARLRDALEPFADDSLAIVDVTKLSTEEENSLLAAMLEWERAPLLSISRWFEPELELPPPASLADDELHELLWDVIGKLAAQRIVLAWTDHLSDRELYSVLLRDVLPAEEKRIDRVDRIVEWRFVDEIDDAETWLRYYATVAERRRWASETGFVPPDQEPAPFPRKLPR